MPIRKKEKTRPALTQREAPDKLPTRAPMGRKYRSFVIYGRSGTGKTTLASTFPKPLLLLDINDQGDESAGDAKKVSVLDIATIEEFENALLYLHAHPDEYATVVIDTVTQLQDVLMRETIKPKEGKRIGDWGTITKQEWGHIAGRMKTFISDLRDLPLNAVFLAQDRVHNLDEDSDPEFGLEPEVGPRLMPSVASHLNAAVGVIGHTYIRERRKEKKSIIDYCLGIGPSPTHIHKVRKSKTIKLPSFIVDPNYDDIIDAIKGE